MSKTTRRPVVAVPVAAPAPETASGTPVIDVASAAVVSANTPAPVIPETGPSDNDRAEGRVLSAFDSYLPNDVASWPVTEAIILEDGGFIDCDPAAVTYAKSLSA